MLKDINMEKQMSAVDFERRVVYYPEIRPGYVGWVSLYQFNKNELGISFAEVRRGANKNYVPVPLEFAEVMVLPYRMMPDILSSANPDYISEYVYMKSSDKGKTWTETGRCDAFTRHYWSTGFKDGRIVRASSTAYQYESKEHRNTAVVEESLDGGNNWKVISEFLHGYFYYIHKIKKLRGERLIILGTLISAFGPGSPRKTRHTQIPGVIMDEQNGFMISDDGGYTWSGPHYVLPGMKGNEYDMVELDDGRFLFFNSTVQADRSCRQFVRLTKTGYANDPLLGVNKGSPTDNNPQGGITPETICLASSGLLVGSRRCGFNGGCSCSNDLGGNWHVITGMPESNYQPVIETLPDGSFVNAWHYGSDSRFGEVDMFIGVDLFKICGSIPKASKLSLERMLSPDGSVYLNSFRAMLLSDDGIPAADRRIEFRKKEIHRADGTYNLDDIKTYPVYASAYTDKEGSAVFSVPEKDKIPDIHDFYQVYASFTPDPGDDLERCESEVIGLYNMRTSRDSTARFPAYYNTGLVMITPDTAKKYPELAFVIDKLDKSGRLLSIEDFVLIIDDRERADAVLGFLVSVNLLKEITKGEYEWYIPIYRQKPYFTEVRICDIEEYCI